jgi:hypothetical protein
MTYDDMPQLLDREEELMWKNADGVTRSMLRRVAGARVEQRYAEEEAEELRLACEGSDVDALRALAEKARSRGWIRKERNELQQQLDEARSLHVVMINDRLKLQDERDAARSEVASLQRDLDEQKLNRNRDLHAFGSVLKERDALVLDKESLRRELDGIKGRFTAIVNLVCETAHNFPASCPNEEEAVIAAITGGIQKAVAEISEKARMLVRETNAVTDGKHVLLEVRSDAAQQAAWKMPLRKAADDLMKTLKRWKVDHG